MNDPSFRFRLERIRALRERSEDAAKLALAGALFSEQRSRAEFEAAEERVTGARAAQVEAGAQPTSAIDLLARQAYLERTEHERHAAGRDLDRQRREVAGRRDELTSAARDRQALERLKQQRFAAFQRDMLRREAATLDEIATTNFLRRAA